ncbi:hypothetical protein BAY13_17240 [Elizabethkingia bruuniana]|uniref:hypothetical protein n=1 Tax=Elizabethkingia bruuniana TaxID=1756149 RepID=UPI000999E224|nr:hypothetical protein [Elizabethkingia bruuniana]OPC66477.1 hypothetical protein BAY13_17240 [Elizabethkingia bruuniana]
MKTIILGAIAFLFLCTSCRKNDELENKQVLNTVQQFRVNDGRLSFPSQETLTQKLALLRQGSKLNLPKGFYSFKEFWASLIKDDSKEKELLKYSIILPDDDSQMLVPDPAFASLLNSKLEIQVDNRVYKITRFGTFIIDLDQYEHAEQIIGKLYEDGTRLTEIRMLPGETNTGMKDYYKVSEGIYRLDTYKNFETGKIRGINGIKTKVVSSRIVNPGTVPAEYIVYTDYTNDKVFNDFDSKHRMRANFSEYNWLAATHLGIELTFQKKGWTQIWRQMDTEELNIINNHTVLNRVPNYQSPIIYDIPQHIPVGQPYYFNAPNVITEVAAPGNAIGIRQSNGRVEYNFNYNYTENYGTSQLGYSFIPAAPGADNKPSYTYVNVGCYAKYNGRWEGIIYKRGW